MARIAVAYNDDAAHKTHLNETERLGELEVIATAHEAAQLLGATLVAVRDDVVAAVRELRAFDAVVNLCEGVRGVARYEMHFALALEMAGIAHTSCEPIATGLATDKALVKKLLRAAGVATPRTRDEGGKPPFIVKPSLEDAGIGIDATSVVDDPEERIAHVEATYGQPALVEEFIDGCELNQALFLGRALPPGEVVFADALAARERVVGWKAKWASGSREDLATVSRTPADLTPAQRDALAQLATHAANVLGLDMYVRFDVRMSADGVMHVIDVNPNPDLGAGSGYRKALDAAGIGFRDFLDALIMRAIERRRR